MTTMEPRTRDLSFLIELAEILQEEDVPSKVLEDAYQYVFFDRLGRSRATKLTDPQEWHDRQLQRAIQLVLEIVPRYTQLFQNPQTIPVTHYKRQKTLSIHLDEQFARILRERVRRSKVGGMLDETGATISDPVLDTPILDLKQEARSKTFPKNKRGEISSLKKLKDRFEDKLFAKGIRPELVEKSEPESRFTYGP